MLIVNVVVSQEVFIPLQKFNVSFLAEHPPPLQGEGWGRVI
jgi:hypothetical protein